jgi:hypothetical protein
MVLSYGDKNNSGAGVKAPIDHLIVADVLLVSCKDNHLCVSGRIMAKKRPGCVAIISGLARMFLRRSQKADDQLHCDQTGTGET